MQLVLVRRLLRSIDPLFPPLRILHALDYMLMFGRKIFSMASMSRLSLLSATVLYMALAELVPYSAKRWAVWGV